MAFFVSSYAIPLLLIIFLYIGMLHRLWNPGSLGNKISKESLRNKRRVTKWVQFLHKVLSDQRRTNIILFYRLVLVVIVVFCVCWAPIQVVLVLRAVGLYQTKSSEDYPRIIFLIFGQVLAYFNRYVVTQLGPNCVTSTGALIASFIHSTIGTFCCYTINVSDVISPESLQC